MADFTKKGHRLVHVEGLVFECSNRRWVNVEQKDGKPTLVMRAPFVLGRIQVYAPSTEGQVAGVLRAWLSAYGDDDLFGQIEEAVQKAFESFPDAASPTPTKPPPSNPGWN